MKEPILLVVHPVRRTTARDEVGACESDEETRERWLEVRALEAMLAELGCERWEGRDRVWNFEAQGCNWEAGMAGSVWTVPREAVQAIHARFQALRAAREAALAKLTDEECYALGVTRHRKERLDPEAYIDFLSDQDLMKPKGRKKK